MYIQHRATSAMRIDDSVVKKCLFLTGARVECRPKLLGLSWKKKYSPPNLEYWKIFFLDIFIYFYCLRANLNSVFIQL